VQVPHEESRARALYYGLLVELGLCSPHCQLLCVRCCVSETCYVYGFVMGCCVLDILSMLVDWEGQLVGKVGKVGWLCVVLTLNTCYIE
jgi:hypothetical protein